MEDSPKRTTINDWELLVCDTCGAEAVRAKGRRLALPCRQCRGSRWTVFSLERGEPVRVIEIK